MSSNVELDGLKTLRTGSLLLIIAPILTMVGLSAALGGLFSGSLAFAAAGASAELGAAIVGALLELAAVYMFMKGFGTLREVAPEVGIGRTGSMLVLVAVILLIIGLAGLLAGAFPLVFLVGLGALLDFIGIIMVAIGFYRVGSRYGEGLVKVGGILLIFGGLAFIGAILNYIGLGGIIRKKFGQ